MNSPPGYRRDGSRDADAGLLSPGGVAGLGLRESGDIEGVRQQSVYVSGDITDTDQELWRHRTIIHKSHMYNERLVCILHHHLGSAY